MFILSLQSFRINFQQQRYYLSNPSSVPSMVSSSTSSIQKSFKYDVFISFRGLDTRKNFVDHLYHALKHTSIYTYKDDERITRGKRISDELIGSIKDSKFHIIVFSKNYASSSWCLDELVKIMECHKTNDHTAYPIFYDVEPTEVRNQSGAVGEAFVKHEKEEDARKWRQALKEAADLAGWELKNTADGHEARFIKKIVEELSLELRSINFSIDEKLVGMEIRIKDVMSCLATDIDDVRMIGIKGMGGGGKTTLARAVFDQISFHFEGKSFIDNVREVSNASLSGLKSLQSQVLSDVLNDHCISITSVHEGKNKMKQIMRDRKVLVVLDDVDHIDQLDALAGEPDWFKDGSRIIITTREEQVLVAHRVNVIQNVNLLSYKEAICLFSRYAFGREIPTEGYEELSREVVRYAAGLPLTIRVLGSFLCGKSELEWIDAQERLKTIPLTETMKKLELSYIGLDEDYKEIFLDVACILQGWRKENAIEFLESCRFHARNGLKVLEQKSLINTTLDFEYVNMHDHIKELGRNIVRRSHPDKPNKHSRLWIKDEIEDILVNDLGTKATRHIRLWSGSRKLNPETVLKGLRMTTELRSLHLSLRYFDASRSGCFNCNWKFNHTSPYLPNTLQYLFWNGYPFRSLPETFQAYNLVGLNLMSSRMVQLWEGGAKKVLNKLRFLRLNCLKLRTLDLGLAPNLETLTVGECRDLLELYMPVACPKLKSIDLSGTKLRTLDLGPAPNLKVLILNECRDLVELYIPHGCLKLENLNFTRLKLRILELGSSPNLEALSLYECKDLIEFHFPDGCVKLKYINFTRTKLTSLDLGLALNLEILILDECEDLVELHMPSRSVNLISLLLNNSKSRTLDIGLSPNLEHLNLNNCYHLEELNMSDECQKLTSLEIRHSKLRTLDLQLTPNLKKLDLKECHNLVIHSHSIKGLEKLVYLNLTGCLSFGSFLFETTDYGTSCTVDESLEVGPLAELHLVAESLERCQFHPDNSLPKFEFACFYKENRHLLTGNLEKLVSIGLCACTNLETFSQSICGLQHLRKLILKGNIPEAPRDLNQLECLEELTLLSTDIIRLPDSICMLKNLKSLELISCWCLEKLPEDFGLLKCLEELHLSCTKIKHLPDSICMLKHLKYLELVECLLLEKLPEDVGRLECLEELTLSSTKIEYLPDSICMLKHLESLELNHCLLLEKLPEDLGQLECLEKLNLMECKILRGIPNSICKMICLKELDLQDTNIRNRKFLLCRGVNNTTTHNRILLQPRTIVTVWI
ncbi:unnamed protein product [Lactuca saligna]|uniref:TIR domain-containing protein n=1 Tax=Lactuca saligna TaxID=75948 RepID=A0AA36EN62_LACSI|nr:unnamed protein product [Lactuca saligna]